MTYQEFLESIAEIGFDRAMDEISGEKINGDFEIYHYNVIIGMVIDALQREPENLWYPYHLLHSIYNDEGNGEDWWLFDYTHNVSPLIKSISSPEDVEVVFKRLF